MGQTCTATEKLCFSCHMPGHISAKCPNNKQNKNQTVTKGNERVICFMGDACVLSNICMKYATVMDNVTYKCNEQFIQESKALLFGDIETAEAIMSCDNPYDMRNLGKNVANFQYKVWKENVDGIVRKCNEAKFHGNPSAMEELMKTGDKVIAEATRDTYWGIGVHLGDEAVLDQSTWQGRNVMGQILMKIRGDMQADFRQDKEDDEFAESGNEVNTGGDQVDDSAP